MLPTTDQPTIITMPNGQKAILTLKLLDGSTPIPLSMVQSPPAPPAPVPTLVAPLAVQKVAAAVPPPAALPASGRLIDAPEVGGKLTLFVLCYGDYPDMHRRCLKGIEATTKPEFVDLRVYLNQACRETVDLVTGMHQRGRVNVVYRAAENRRKYPAMREMFRDPAHPITTKWLTWFDDDTMCDVDPLWFDKLVTALQQAAARDPNLGMLGSRYFFKMAPKHAEWVKAGGWYAHRPFRDKAGSPAPNGDKIHFGTGSFWTLKTECVDRCDIPDPRITHNGGDIAIGEQLYQQGYNMKHWNGDKKTVLWSSVKRRGLSEAIFGV